MRTGEQGLVHQAIVLHKTHEDAAQQPGHRRLGEHALPPDLKDFPGAPSLPGRLVFTLQGVMQRLIRVAALTQVIFETPQQTFEIVEQTLGIDHNLSLHKFLLVVIPAGNNGNRFVVNFIDQSMLIVDAP
jgi:hypothetical protein